MKKQLISFAMVIVLVIVFGIFIYPGIYKYDKLNQNSPIRINRFTGEMKILTVNGWKDVTNNVATTANPSSSTFFNKSTVEPAKETPVVLGDISKIKIIENTFDNTLFYKIDCTVKNEDVLGNNVYIKATLFDENKNPINILTSEPQYIKANESATFKLSTDDYNMTSKYKSYELEVIQGYHSERRAKILEQIK